LLFLSILLTACTPVSETGDPFAPVVSAPPPAPAPVVAPVVKPDDVEDEVADADDEGSPEETTSSADPRVAQAKLLGLDPEDLPPLEDDVAVGITVAEMDPQDWPADADLYGFTQPPPDIGLSAWGIRLISTTVAANPTRAMVGLPDGTELVVKAGTLLPEVGVVILAIGSGRVQIAEITPAGDHARITPKTITALYAPDGI
jgi:hypothetical protein